MTEHEKLLAGQEYDYRDSELQQMIARGNRWRLSGPWTTDSRRPRNHAQPTAHTGCHSPAMPETARLR